MTSYQRQSLKMTSLVKQTEERGHSSKFFLKLHRPTCKDPNEKLAPNESQGCADANLKELKTSTYMYKCELCGLNVKYLSRFHRHMKSTHIIQSSACDETVSTRMLTDPRFSCALCGDRYLKQFDLNRHVCEALKSKLLLSESDTNGKTGHYECDVCKKMFKANKIWKRHMDVHLGQQKHQCPVCGLKFSDKRGVTRHMRTHTREGGAKNKIGSDCVSKYFCTVCHKSFKIEKTLRDHRKECLLNPLSKIKIAILKKNVTSDGATGSKRHRDCPPTSKWQCAECGENFSHNADLSRHISSEHSSVRSVEEDTQHQCSSDDKSHKKDVLPVLDQDVMEPLRTHEEKNPALCCALCGKRFGLQYHLNRHRCDALDNILLIESNAYNNENNLSCAVCNSKFSNMRCWKKHMDVHLGQERHQCSVCGKKYAEKRDFKDHMRTHTGPCPFHCNLCPLTFKDKNRLTKHVRTHSSKWECNICDESVTSLLGLKKHMRNHFASHRHLCLECFKGFVYKASLQQHCIEEHSSSQLPLGDETLSTNGLQEHAEETRNEEKYQCFLCDKELKTEEKLKSHLGFHMGVKPHACSECTERFYYPSQLKIHMNIHTK